MDTACQNNHPHLNLHVRGSSHLKCQTCKMNCLQKPNWETSIAPKFQTISTGEEKELTLNCGRNLYKISHFILATPLLLLALQGYIPFVIWTAAAGLWSLLIPGQRDSTENLWSLGRSRSKYSAMPNTKPITTWLIIGLFFYRAHSLQTNPLFEKTV